MYFLESKDIGLRVLEESDVNGNYGNWFNDNEVCKYNSHHRFPVGRQELVNFINHCDSKDKLVFAVELKEGKNHIGNISLQNINYIDRSAEISFIMGERDFWGKGYAAQAAIVLINHAFYQLGLARIYFGTSEKNIGMQKVGEKLRFKKEGIRRKAIYKNGAFCDIYEYGLLRDEWEYENI